MVRTITVKGTGRVSVPPDYIKLNLTLDTLDPDYEKMQKQAAVRLDALYETVAGLGFEKDALKTVDYDISTATKGGYDRDNNYNETFLGYRCNHELKLSFDFEKNRLSEVLLAISRCRAKPELEINFTVKDPDAVREELLRAATRNARQKAEILAAESGVRLGRLLTISYDWKEIEYTHTLRKGNDGTDFNDILYTLDNDIHPDTIDAKDSAGFIWEIE